MKNTNVLRDFDKVLKTINSCTDYKQVHAAEKMFYNWEDLHDGFRYYKEYWDYLRDAIINKESELILKEHSTENDKI